MNILKAILLTVLLVGLEILVSFGFYEFLQPKVVDSLSETGLTHYYGITGRIPAVIAYLVVFYLSYRSVFNFKNGLEKIRGIKLEFLVYLILITIGLEFVDRPLFDLNKIYANFSVDRKSTRLNSSH